MLCASQPESVPHGSHGSARPRVRPNRMVHEDFERHAITPAARTAGRSTQAEIPEDEHDDDDSADKPDD